MSFRKFKETKVAIARCIETLNNCNDLFLDFVT